MKVANMNLIEIKTGNKLNGLIKRVSPTELRKLKGNENFSFDWSEENLNKVYKITLKGKNEILGLISIFDVPHEFRIHINLIESAVKHRGKCKKINHIPGCLIAFACSIAFQKGYDGFVSLIPKTKLIDYYQNRHGFVQVGRQMAVFMESSKSLITKYLEDEEV